MSSFIIPFLIALGAIITIWVLTANVVSYIRMTKQERERRDLIRRSAKQNVISDEPELDWNLDWDWRRGNHQHSDPDGPSELQGR